MSEHEHEADIPLEEPAPELAPDEVEQEEAAEEQEEKPIDTDEEPDNHAASRDDADVEAKQKALTKAARSYGNVIGKTLGDDLDGWQMCPLCNEPYPGIRLPRMPTPEAVAHVRVAIGLEPGDNLPADNYSRTCTACDGWGFTSSGSKVPGQDRLTCHDCSGRGWIPVGTERESGRITLGNGTPDLSMPILQDNPSNDPPEVAMLQQLGYIVTKVPRIEPLPPVPGL